MRYLLGLIRRAFQFGKGRPAALVILLWMSSLSVLSELTLNDSLAQYTGSFTTAFGKAREFLFDSYQKTYPREPLSQPVTIVAIDEKSLSQVGQWPWPRNRLANLINTLAAYQPAAIGLDMYMPERDQTSPDIVAGNLPEGSPQSLLDTLTSLPSHETILASALYHSPSILGAAGFDSASYTTSAGLRSKPLLIKGDDALPYLRKFDAVLASLPELQAAAKGQAILSVDLDFGVVRKIPLLVAIGDTPVSGLAMEMLRVATGEAAVRVSVGAHGIESVGVADLTVPTQAGGTIWLHFARSEDTLGRYVSAASVLDGTVDPEQLTGKLVLLGLTGSGLHDMRTTALGELVPGIEIQAQVLEALFDGRLIIRPWWMKWLETGVILCLGLLFIWYIPRSDSQLARFLQEVPRASVWITLAINFSFLVTGYLLFRHAGLLFDASSLFIVLSSIVGSLIASALLEISLREKALEEELQRAREAANLIAGEFAYGLDKPILGTVVRDLEEVCQLTREFATEAAKHPSFSAVLDAAAIEQISWAAPYRDIGLTQVPKEILQSRQPLTAAQRKQIEQHVVVGAFAIESVYSSLAGQLTGEDQLSEEYLSCLSEVVAHHHENWNGSGYPGGLRGNNIPLAARLVAIVDTFESLINERPWRTAMETEQALEVIVQEKGSRFEPELVDCFLAVISSRPVHR